MPKTAPRKARRPRPAQVERELGRIRDTLHAIYEELRHDQADRRIAERIEDALAGLRRLQRRYDPHVREQTRALLAEGLRQLDILTSAILRDLKE